jgi:hypothetical protein
MRKTAKRSVITPAITHGSNRASLPRDGSGAEIPAAGPPSWIHFSCTAMSCAVCQRSSGSFARHVRTTRSNAGGVIGVTVDTAGGSDPMIEEMREAWLLPENAFFPVAIS